MVKKSGNELGIILEGFNTRLGKASIDYESDFPIKYKWSDNNQNVYLSGTKSNSKIAQNIFYTRSIVGNELMIL